MYADSIGRKKRGAGNVKAIHAALDHLHGGRDVRSLPDFQGDDFETKCGGRCLNRALEQVTQKVK